MFTKSGACYAKEIREWFDPRDQAHIIAFFQYEKTGRWPENFLDDVWFLENDWQQELRQRIAEAPLPAKVRAYMDELDRIQKVVDQVTFPYYQFVVEPLADQFTIHVRCDELHKRFVSSRRWLFPAGQTPDQIVQTCFEAVVVGLEHWAKESFQYQGQKVGRP